MKPVSTTRRKGQRQTLALDDHRKKSRSASTENGAVGHTCQETLALELRCAESCAVCQFASWLICSR